MHHRTHWARLAAVLTLTLMLLSGFASIPATAQDDPTPEPTAAEATGTLTIATFSCVTDEVDEGTITVTTPDTLAGLECEPGGPATISIDGGDPVEVADGDSLELPAGVHTVTEVTQGGSLEIEVPEGGEAAIAIVTAVASAEEPGDEPTATEETAGEAELEQAAEGSIRVVTHLCRQGFADGTQLNAVEWPQQLVACPVAALPDDYGNVTADAITANDPENPLPYDLTINYSAAGTDTSVSIADAALATAALCESALGNLNGDADDDRCWDQSGYEVTDASEGAASIAVSTPPESYSLALAIHDPATDDAAIGSPDFDAGIIPLDTTADLDVTVHLFLLPEPLEHTVTVVGHLCPEPITSRSAFTNIGDFWAQIQTCPSFVLPGDAPAPDGLTAGELNAAIAVRGPDEVSQAMADVPFEQTLVCEADLPQDINGNPSDNLCLDQSRYVFSNVLQGSPVTVDAKGAAPGTKYVGVAFDPGSSDGTTLLSAGATGTIKLDTTADGDVTIHVFYGPLPPPTATVTATRTPTLTPTPGGPTATRTPTPRDPTATRTPTRTPAPDDPTATNTPTESAGGTGSLQVFKFWCEGSETLTRINALAPGADATREDLGDATCANGNTEFILYNGAGAEMQTFMVPPVGVLLIDNLPVTGGGVGQYRLVDTRSSESATFSIAANTVTKVISLQYMEVDEIGDPPPIPTIDLDENPPPPPDIEDDECFEDGCDFIFDGPVAEPGDGDPFTVQDDPEAEARVNEVDSFEDMPGVGIGPGEQRRDEFLPWVIALALITGILALVRIRH